MNINRRVNYRNFGFIPGNGILRDMYGKLFGHRNLYKRLQARDMMRALDIQLDETVLDIGCGLGYITLEIAKQAKMTIGVDIEEVIAKSRVPSLLKDRLKFVSIVPGQPLPIGDNAIDKVYASEIIGAVSDTTQFLGELKRVLKPGGKLILCNGCGHPAIEAAYEKPNWLFRRLKRKHPDRFPATYAEYAVQLNKTFGNQIDWFYRKEDLDKVLGDNGFDSQSVSYSPGLIPGRYISWMQFTLCVRDGKTLSEKNFLLKFLILSAIQKVDKRKYEGGVLYEAINKK